MSEHEDRHAAPQTAKLTLYIPEQNKYGMPIDPEIWIDKASRVLASIAGGATILPKARGVWLEGDLLITEPVHIIYSFLHRKKLLASLDELSAFVRHFAVEAEQAAVAFELDGKLYLVDPNVGEAHDIH